MIYLDRIAHVLQCFGPVRGEIFLEGRTMNGIDSGWPLLVRPPFSRVPDPLLVAVAQGWTFRLHVVTRRGGTALDVVPILAVVWKPRTSFYATAQARAAAGNPGEPLRQRFIDEAARGAIRASLALMPPPSVVIEGGPEVAAGWRLAVPVPASEAGSVLERFARRLAAEKPPEDLAVFTIPLCGFCRSWNQCPPEIIEIPTVDPTRIYRLEDLTAEPANPAAADQPHIDQERIRGRTSDSSRGQKRRDTTGGA